MTICDDLCSIRSIAKRLYHLARTVNREFKRINSIGVYGLNFAQLQSLKT